MSATTSANAAPVKPSAKAGYRPEIQGIRAVAALLVATFHIWLGRVSGGVDVFFIMSGFLVTTTLLGHYARFGHIRPLFYLSRLARRLLPAALTVLLVVTVLTWFLLPKVSWARNAREIIASMFYYENWSLAASSVDYLAQFEDKTPVQHFWAMSVQGQFYLIWLAIFVIVALIAKSIASRRRAVLIAFIVVFVLSFLWSLYEVAINQPFAYFDTTARTWEFALGGIAAIVLPMISLPTLWRAILSWVGLAGIISCGLVLQVSDKFPGYAALWPTLSALCILLAGGAVHARFSAARLLGTKPFVWLGDISYGIYLWHWPMLVIFMAVTSAEEVGLRGGLGIIVGAIILAWLTTRFIEKPIAKTYTARKPKPWLRPAIAGVVIVAILGGTTAASAVVDESIKTDVAQLNTLLENPPLDDPCYAANAILSGKDACPLSINRDNVIPNPVTRSVLQNQPCDVVREDEFGAISPCYFGASEEDATKTILLVGDSHAQSIRAAVKGMAVENGWRGIAISQSGCIASLATRHYASDDSAVKCRKWNDDLLKWVAVHPEVDAIFTMGSAGRVVETENNERWEPVARAGYLDEWELFKPYVDKIVVIRDTPRAAVSQAACVDRSLSIGLNAASTCAIPKDKAVKYDAAAVAATDDGDDNTQIVDFTDNICDDSRCYPVIGGVWAYSDSVHLTQLFSSSLAPYLTDQVAAITAAWPDWK